MQSSRVAAFCGVIALSLHGSASEPARAPPLALYVPQMAVPKVPQMPNVPAAPVSLGEVPQVPVMPGAPQMPQMPRMQMMPEMRQFSDMQQVVEVPSAVAQPIAEGPASPFSFLGGFAGGLAVGAAFVYSYVKKTGEKVQKLEMGALRSVDVESPSTTLAGAPNSTVVKSAALAPYLAGGASLPAVLKQVTSGRAPMPALGRQLRAIDTGRGRMRVVVNMQATDDAEFCYGLPGNRLGLGCGLSNFDPAGFTKGCDKLEVYQLREAELTHGRVSMLASLGFLVQESFHPLFSGAGGPAIDQMPQLPVWLWVVMIGGIGSAEAKRIAVGWAEVDESNNPGRFTEQLGQGTTRRYHALKEGYYPGDLGFDPLKLKPTDPKEFRLMQERELAHCRLAMIAAAGFLAQETATRATWGAYWADIF